MNMWKLASCNVKYKCFNYIVMYLLIFIVAAGFLADGFFVKSMKQGMNRTVERMGADIMVVPEGYVTDVEDSLFKGKPCTVNFEEEWLKKIEKVKGVECVSAELYLATLSDAPCCDGGLQLIAFDVNSDFSITPWLLEYGIETLENNQIIVGSSVDTKVGEKITFYNKEFEVAAILDETGMGYDNSAFLSFQATKEIVADEKNKSVFPFGKDANVISAVCVKVKDGCDPMLVKANIEAAYSDSAISVYAVSSKIRKMAADMQQFELFGTIFNLLQAVISLISLFALTTISANDRRKEVFSMEVAGIPKSQILLLFLIEYGYIVMLAIISAALLVAIGMFPMHSLIKKMINVPYVQLTISEFLLLLMKISLGMILLISFAAFHSFYRLWKQEEVERKETLR